MKYITKRTLTIVGSICLIGAAVFFVLTFLNHESRTTSGGYPEPEKSSFITCTSTGLDYPYYRYDNSLRKETEVNMIFRDEIIDSISLTHILFYNNEQESIGSEAQNHASMGIHFAKDGLGADPFSAHYSIESDRMTMSLYAKATDLSQSASKYFLLNHSENKLQKTEYKKIYESQGFKCDITD